MPSANRAAAILCICAACLTAHPPDDSAVGPATVCLERPPQKQCYSAPKDFERNAQVTVVQLQKDLSALLFSVESGGVTGFGIHFALLRPGAGKDLENLFPESQTTVSDQSQHAFWSDPTISDTPIFLTADYAWGPGESHFDPHRYMISSYLFKRTFPHDPGSYYLEDRYMTVRKYDYEKDDILAAEKIAILARLKLVKESEGAR
jgi:hypothetical protein